MKDLSLHLLDIAQNSITAGATRIKIFMCHKNGVLIFRVEDNGNGMEKEFLETVTDPFSTTRNTRKVGMGLPLLKLSAEMAGGKLSVKSERRKGTVVEADFLVNSIDRIPAGDFDETMKALILANPGLDFELTFRNEMLTYTLKTMDLKKTLSGVPLSNPEIIDWIGKNIREGLYEVFGGVLNEISG